MSKYFNTLTVSDGNVFGTTISDRDPNINDDKSKRYKIGSKWINKTRKQSFLCMNNANGNALWKLDDEAGSDVTVVNSNTYQITNVNRIIKINNIGSTGALILPYTMDFTGTYWITILNKSGFVYDINTTGMEEINNMQGGTIQLNNDANITFANVGDLWIVT